MQGKTHQQLKDANKIGCFAFALIILMFAISLIF